MILVDTSVWIDFFNHPASVYTMKLKSLIEQDEDICLLDIILTEILQGIKDDSIFKELKEYLVLFPIIRVSSIDTYVLAVDIYRLCRKKGKTISKTVDAIIAAAAIENNVRVFSKDKDFSLIADCCGLKLFNL